MVFQAESDFRFNRFIVTKDSTKLIIIQYLIILKPDLLPMNLIITYTDSIITRFKNKTKERSK